MLFKIHCKLPNLDARLNTDNNLFSHKIYSRYFSPHNFKKYSNSLTKKQLESSFSIFHNNIVSLNNNLEKLVTHYLENLDFHFNIIDENYPHKSKFCYQNSSLCFWARAHTTSLMKTLITQCLKRSRMKPFRHCGSKFLLANRRMSYTASYIANTILQVVLLNISVIQSKS